MINGYGSKQFPMPTKRYCQVMELKNEEALIAAYKRAHSREEMWQEVLDGIRSVGILEMEIYIVANKLVMIVETPLEFEWESAMTKLATLPRQAEWENFVARFQQCAAGATSDQKWQLTERIFTL